MKGEYWRRHLLSKEWNSYKMPRPRTQISEAFVRGLI